MDWKKTSVILCMFGFLKEFRPSEPFLANYLIGPWKNFTLLEVNQDINPCVTYSNMAFLVFVFLITDFLRYKPIIVFCGLSGTISFIIILFGKSLVLMQVAEVFFGLFLSTEVAYYTYMYAAVQKTHYQKVTGFARAAFLFGRFMAGLVGQLTVTYGLLDYEQLLYLTIPALVFSTAWAFLLPKVNDSIYYHRVNNTEISTPPITIDPVEESGPSAQERKSRKSIHFLFKLKQAYFLLWKDFLKAYTNRQVLKWSLWWAFASCGYVQVISYVHLVWISVYGNDVDKIYNAAVEALLTIIGAVAVFVVGTLRINWPLFGELTLAIFSVIEGFLLYVTFTSHNIWLLYAVYIIFGVIYHIGVTVASFEVVKYISEDSYSLIFGINIFLALIFQSFLTLIVSSGNIFVLNIREQFLVYSGYFGILGLIFIIMAAFKIINFCREGRSLQFWLINNRESN